VAPDLEPWSRGAALDIAGRPLPRRSALEKVTGRARYAFDVQLPGMIHGVIARSRIPRGRIASIDTSKAARVEGVRFILTPENFPALPLKQKPEIPVPRRPAISREVRFVGEEIAAVAAETEEAAEEAVRLLEVSYEPLPAVLEPEDAVRDGAPQLTWPGNLVGGKPEIYERGNLAEGEAAAEIVLERRYSTEVQHHNPLEPHCCVASWLGEELTSWRSRWTPTPEESACFAPCARTTPDGGSTPRWSRARFTAASSRGWAWRCGRSG
jgi:xanthine dehydrogenase molybdenum-binding subunit